MKSSPKPTQHVRVASQLVLDIPVALSVDSDPLTKDIQPALAKFRKLLASTMFVWGRKVLGDQVVVGKKVEDRKKGKGKGGKQEVVEDEDEDQEQEVLNVELLVTETPVEDVVVEDATSARMKVAGKLSCRAYLPPGARVGWAKDQVRADLARSLHTRLGMHAETYQKEEGEQEVKVVHEPPR